MNKPFIAIILLLLSIQAKADTISDINLWIGADGITWIEEKVIVSGENKTSTIIKIPEFIKNVTVSGPEGRLDYTIKNDGKYNKIKVNLKKPLRKDETKNVLIKFGSPLLTVKTGGNWVASYYTPATPRETILRINFPVGSKIIELEPEDVLRSYEKYALWLYPHRSEIEFKVTYEYGGITPPTTTIIPQVSTTLDTKNTTQTNVSPLIMIGENTFFIILGMLIIVIFMLMGFIFWKKKLSVVVENKNGLGGEVEYKPPDDFVAGHRISEGNVSYSIESAKDEDDKKGDVKDSIIKMLDDKELAIIKILEKAGEEVTQAHIYKTTGIPKTSLSDIIKRIEKRNLIETKKEGRVKWIKLKPWVRE